MDDRNLIEVNYPAGKRLKDPETGHFVSKNPEKTAIEPRYRTQSQALRSFRAIYDESVSEQEWRDIIDAQKQKALNGDSRAAKLLMETRFGKPGRMEQAETGGMKEFMSQIASVMAARPVENVIEVVAKDDGEEEQEEDG